MNITIGRKEPAQLNWGQQANWWGGSGDTERGANREIDLNCNKQGGFHQTGKGCCVKAIVPVAEIFYN